MLALPLLLTLLCDVHVDEVHGFRIEVPEGWSTSEQDSGSEGFALRILPPGSSGSEGVTVTVLELDEGTGIEAAMQRTRQRVQDGGEDYSAYEEWQGQLGERDLPCARVNLRTPAGEFHVELGFVVENGMAYLLQQHAIESEFAERSAALEEVLATFELIEVSAQGLEERTLARLAERCGNEVDWAADWDEAEERARRENRLILVVAFLLPGFALNETPRNTLFMDQDVIELVNERFVPLWYTRGMEAPISASYGMGSLTFGQALLVAMPDGAVVLESREASSADVAYPFLCAALARNQAFAGSAVPSDLASLERATRHVARGELETALELLGEERSGSAQRLRARILRLQRRGAEALAALAAAREAGGEPEAGLLLEEAELLIREGEQSLALEALEQIQVEHAQSEECAQALILQGMVALATRDSQEARSRWREVVERYPTTRWAWRAASLLGSTALDADVGLDLGWPDADLLRERLTFPERAQNGLEDAPAAALAWLLSAQRSDGSWLCPMESSLAIGPDPFVDAITALCGSALLRHGDSDGAKGSARRALAFILASVERRKRTPPRVFFMDYMTWSDSMMLAFLADALELGLGEEDSIRRAAGALVADLGERQQESGGWSYYVTGDLDGAAAPAQSISFTTAAGVLALVRAREAGFSVPDIVLDAAVSALERMRGDDGVFAYFLYSDTGRASNATAAPGAVGRGPACELALLRAGESSPARVRASLDAFLEHAPLFAAEQGKVLMHAGPDGQGCHYLFFDYTHAAFAQASLPDDPGTRVRILELVKACRQPDGSFLDTPILGRSYGTAMALLAFDALSVEPSAAAGAGVTR